MISELLLLIHHTFQIHPVCVALLVFSLLSFFIHSGDKIALSYGSVVSPQSSVTILSGSLASNQTYQFKVSMINRRNSTLQTAGYLLVQVIDTRSEMILVK
jgi:hypothetical protein